MRVRRALCLHFWGLHECDAFLLVVDGVPWGGAFNASITTLNLTGVRRIDALKGAVPVMYGGDLIRRRGECHPLPGGRGGP